MKKLRRPFPASTLGVHKPGVGITLTRANIHTHEAARMERFRQLGKLDDYQPLTAEQLAREFTLPSGANKDFQPSKRHTGRAYRLLHGRKTG